MIIKILFNWLFPCRHGDPACRDNFWGCRCGKGTEIVQASAPAQPTTAESIDSWVKALPQIYEAQAKYAPQEAAQQVALAQQYALPLGQAYQQAQEGLYPGTSAIQENLAAKANQGISATTMPDWMRQQYTSDINANLGTNAGSPIGAEYVSRGLQKQLFEQQKYYNDLGLSLSGRQPLTQAQAPQTSNYASTFTPATALNFAQQGYGTYAQASRPLGFTQSQGTSLGFLGNWGGY